MFPVDFLRKDFNLLSDENPSKESLLESQFNINFNDLGNPRHIYRDLSISYTHTLSNKVYSWVPSVDPSVPGKWRMESDE